MTSTDQTFSSIAVIGAGTMGSGIAAQIANAGHDVLLLDLPARTEGETSPAEQAIDRLLASDPPQLMHKRNAGRIITGSITDDFDRLATCDWIIEAVVERLDIKKDLYARLDATIGADCVSSARTPRQSQSACWSRICQAPFVSVSPSPIISTPSATCVFWNLFAAPIHART